MAKDLDWTPTQPTALKLNCRIWDTHLTLVLQSCASGRQRSTERYKVLQKLIHTCQEINTNCWNLMSSQCLLYRPSRLVCDNDFRTLTFIFLLFQPGPITVICNVSILRLFWLEMYDKTQCNRSVRWRDVSTSWQFAVISFWNEWQRRWQWSLVASLKPGVGLSYFLLQRCHFKRGWGLIYKLHTGCKTKTTVQWRDLCLSLRAFLDVMQQESTDVYWKDNGVLVGYFTL